MNNNDVYQTAIGIHGYVETVVGQPSATTTVASAKQQQPQTASDISSPLLVNLLR